MQTLRRWYLYVVTFVSLEVVLWGIIGLARSFFSGQRSESIELLAGGLALILVGVPVFLFHGWLAQRSALRDEDERSSRTRAFFLYGALLATLLPVVQNFLALINRWLLDALGQEIGQAIVGAGQISSDNLIAILANAGVAGGIFVLLRQDWKAGPTGEPFVETRRLHRYLWVIYALALALPGTQQVLRFLFLAGLPDNGVLYRSGADKMVFANGLSVAIIGVPLWFFVQFLAARSWQEPVERESLLRRIVIFLAIFAGAMGGLVGSAQLLGGLLFFIMRLISGAGADWQMLLGDAGEALAILLPYGAVWFFYQRILRLDLHPRPDLEGAEREAIALKRSGLRRMYLYLLAMLGLAWTLIGTTGFLTDVFSLLFDHVPNLDAPFIRGMTETLSAAFVGLPVWIITWRPVQREAAVDGEAGDHARRSLVREGTIYLALFAGLAGAMVGTGLLLFNLFNTALGNAATDLLYEVFQSAHIIVLYTLVLVYHWLVLRADGKLAQRSLGRQHAQFPVLILAPDNGGFSEQLVNALKHQAPAIPVAVHPFSQGVPGEQLSAARAVILPAELLAKPTEAIRLWLQGFDGVRLVIPVATPGWQWILGSAKPFSTLARQAAQVVRQLAEGRENQMKAGNS